MIEPAVPAGALAGSAQPTLTVAELTLRPWRLDDVPAVVEAYADPEIQRWHGRTLTAPEVVDWIAEADRSWLAETAAQWAVVAGGRVVGRIGCRTISLFDGTAEAAYWVLPGERGRQLAGRTLTAMTEWFFDQVGLHRMELQHSVHNVASCRVAEKAGFQLEGTLRRSVQHADGWHDMHLHARLADER